MLLIPSIQPGGRPLPSAVVYVFVILLASWNGTTAQHRIQQSVDLVALMADAFLSFCLLYLSCNYQSFL